jgi:hypothetical protein
MKKHMKRIISALTLVLSLAVAIPCSSFAATEKEKSFTDAYKKAYEAKDEKALQAFLYTKGADPEALQFFTMMMTSDLGGKITAIELKDLTPEEMKKAGEPMPSPKGGMSKLPVAPTKKLVLKIETADANGTSTNSSESLVAEVDGKYMIPVPAPVK